MFISMGGVSSCGKNTVMNELMKRRKNIKVLEKSSGTTRPPRESDSEFNTYVYMTKDEFQKGIENGMFFEYKLVHDNYYGTLLSRLQLAKDDKDTIYMRDIDVKGNIDVRQFFKDSGIISIFLDAPNEVLRERLKARGDSPEDIERRLSRGEMERSYKGDYDLVIENIDLEKTVQTILDFIDKVFAKTE